MQTSRVRKPGRYTHSICLNQRSTGESPTFRSKVTALCSGAIWRSKYWVESYLSAMRLTLVLCAAFVGVVSAQQPQSQARLSPPIAGYIFDRSGQSVRALTGVPGATAAGDRVPLADSATASFIHPRLPIAAVVTKDGSLVIANWSDTAHIKKTPIAPRFGIPSQVSFAGGSDRALFVTSGGVEVWGGLASGNPAQVYGYDADALGGAPNGTSAMTGDGLRGAVVLDSGLIAEVSETAGVRQLGTGSGVAYQASTGDPVLLAGDGSVTFSANGAVVQGMEPDGVLSSMTGFDGAVVFSPARGTVTMVSAGDGSIVQIDCACNPTGVTQIMPIARLLYFEDAIRGGMLLDATGDTPRIVPVGGLQGWSN